MKDDKPLVCALYARVSTTDQDCSSQLNEMRAFCERRGHQIYAEYVDEGWSGKNQERPQFARVLRDANAKQRKFDAIVVYKLDRFGRSVLHLMESVERLNRRGVRLIACSQSLDTDDDTATGRLMLQILAAVAEFERAMIVERVKAGLVAAKKRGVRIGRARKAVDQTAIMALHLRGKTERQIARELRLPKTLVHSNIKRIAA